MNVETGEKLFDVVDIFCFKQKTAYEVRISDWSSDVCSSDLSIALCGDALWAGPAGRALAEGFAELEARAALGPREIAPESLAPLVRTLLDETAVRPPQGGQDRKSTRLNSSH